MASKVKAIIVASIPKCVESYIYLVKPYLDGGPPYWPSPLSGVVLSMLCGAWMVSNRTEGNFVPSVLAGSVRHACFYQSKRAWSGSISPYFS